MNQTARFENGYALIIGVGSYIAGDVPDLPATKNDADALYKLLTHPYRAGYPEVQVKLLTNEQASREGILDGLKWLVNITKGNPNATVLVFYSGHGGKIAQHDGSSKYVLMPHDYSKQECISTGIAKEEFAEQINAVTAKKMMIFLDCCHAAGITGKGGWEGDFVPTNEDIYKQLQGGVGRVVMAASQADTPAYIINSKYSVFTDALLDALDGSAGDPSGYVTILRTLPYLSETVKSVTKTQKLQQIPVFNADNLEDFPICRVRQPETGTGPFKKSADYLTTHSNENTVEMIQGIAPLQMKMQLNELLDEQGFQAVHTVFERVKASGFEYNKVQLATLRNKAIEPGTTANPSEFIAQLKIFIGTIHNRR